MSVDPKFKMRPGENRYSYIWRIGQHIHSLQEWKDATPIINAELGVDYGESAHRKLYALGKLMWDNVFSTMNYDNEAENLRQLIWETERSKQRYRDERNAFKALNRRMSRSEESMAMLVEAIQQADDIPYSPPVINSSLSSGDASLIIVLSDWHIGECFDNAFGKYNSDIARERLDNLICDIVRLQGLYCADKAYVAMVGDMISGNIHQSISITNRENVVEQVEKCSELLAWLLAEISPHFSHVAVVDVPGNHSRITPNADDCLPGERLDTFIPLIAEGKMSRHYPHTTNVSFDSPSIRKIDATLSLLTVYDKDFLLVHGDYDDLDNKQSVAALENFFGAKPYGIICGHKHYFSSKYWNRVHIFQSGCLSGVGNDYTIKKRLIGADPCQLVLACTDRGVVGIHPIDVTSSHDSDEVVV